MMQLRSSLRLQRLLLWLWRVLPLPRAARQAYLALTHPRFFVGVMALIRDDAGRVLILEHTYRRAHPWGLPGGYLQSREDPAEGLAREVHEEIGVRIAVTALLGAGLFTFDQIDLLYSARLLGGEMRASPEIRGWRYANADELAEILPNQLAMLEQTSELR